MIEFRSVTKKYGDFTAVDNIDFTVNDGEVCVLIGPSGCGKTTSLRMTNRMLEPTHGDIRIDGESITSATVETLRRGIGYVIQSVGLFPHMSVRDNIGIVPRLLGWTKEKRYDRANELLSMIGLDPEQYSTKHPSELSGGEAQRIGVARALAANPPILLMDEPFGAVDPLNREVLQNEFINLQRKLRKTVIFVTHDLDEAIRLGDRIVIMRSGHIVQHDTPEEILAHPVNQFVRDFVGNDRALKRLSCFMVQDHMREGVLMRREDVAGAKREAFTEGVGMIWIHDDEDRLVGMLDERKLNGSKGLDPDRITPVRPKDVGVRSVSDLREALSRILGQGLKAVPVVDDDGRVLGEVRLSDLEELNQEGLD
jgi:osmoprotectant transport system ATP-binding protein